MDIKEFAARKKAAMEAAKAGTAPAGTAATAAIKTEVAPPAAAAPAEGKGEGLLAKRRGRPPGSGKKAEAPGAATTTATASPEGEKKMNPGLAAIIAKKKAATAEAQAGSQAPTDTTQLDADGRLQVMVKAFEDLKTFMTDSFIGLGKQVHALAAEVGSVKDLQGQMKVALDGSLTGIEHLCSGVHSKIDPGNTGEGAGIAVLTGEEEKVLSITREILDEFRSSLNAEPTDEDKAEALTQAVEGLTEAGDFDPAQVDMERVFSLL